MTPAQAPSSPRRKRLSTLVAARRMASEKSTTADVVVLSLTIILPLNSVAPACAGRPAPTQKKLAPPAPVKQRMRATMVDGPLGMVVTTARLPPLAVHLVAELGLGG